MSSFGRMGAELREFARPFVGIFCCAKHANAGLVDEMPPIFGTVPSGEVEAQDVEEISTEFRNGPLGRADSARSCAAAMALSGPGTRTIFL